MYVVDPSRVVGDDRGGAGAIVEHRQLGRSAGPAMGAEAQRGRGGRGRSGSVAAGCL